MDIHNVLESIQSFRHTLPANSRTASAIDQQACLEEISECAEEEGLHSLASLLFEAQQEEFHGIAHADTRIEVNEVIRQFRNHLPANSKTANAIDRGASWDAVSQMAEEEGLHQGQLAAVLLEAQQQYLRRQA